MKKYIAEFIGTFTLVFLGCGSAVLAGDKIGLAGIAVSFGLALMAMIYAIGPVSGCHVNPAVSIGFFASGRMPKEDLAGYLISQFIGATIAAGMVAIIAFGMPENFHLGSAGIGYYGYNLAYNGLGQNGWGQGYAGGFNLTSAMIFELVGTFIFVFTILSTTNKQEFSRIAGLVIGLTLVTIILAGINVSGVSVNPARSFGPAVLVGGNALNQLWMFLIVPSIAGMLAGLVHKLFNKEQ